MSETLSLVGRISEASSDTMNRGAVLVFGGTSDARFICQILDEQRISYTLSVATAVGASLAGDIGGKIRVGRIDTDGIADWLVTHAVQWVIDAYLVMLAALMIFLQINSQRTLPRGIVCI